MGRVQARLHQPPRELRAHLDHVWEVRGEWRGGADWLLPDVGADVSLRIGGAAEVWSGGRWSSLSARTVVGSLRHAVPLRYAGWARTLGLRLPAGTAALLGVTPAELCGVIAPLGDVAPALDRALALWLESGAGLAPLWDLLVRHARARRESALAEGARRLAAPRRAAIGEVAGALSLSRRQLARRFAREVGWTPREFRRLARFSAAVGIAAAGPVAGWSALAQRAGYFDHAHLAHEFRHFAGATPTALFSREWYANFAPTRPLGTSGAPPAR